MIFVALGTQDKKFNRILDLVENIDTDEEIIVQSGFTKYESKRMIIHDYFDTSTYLDYIKSADLIICHGGVGTILNCLSFNKKVIVIPRLKKYGEHQNDHQLQIANAFNKKGYVLVYKEGNDINDIYVKAKSFIPNKFISNNDIFIDKLKEYLDL